MPGNNLSVKHYFCQLTHCVCPGCGPSYGQRSFPAGHCPAIAFLGHGLAQALIVEDIDKSVACIMAALGAMQDCLLVQRYTIVMDQNVGCLQHDIHFQEPTSGNFVLFWPPARLCFIAMALVQITH